MSEIDILNLIKAKNGNNTKMNDKNMDYLEGPETQSHKASITSKNNYNPELRRDYTFGKNGRIDTEHYFFIEKDANLISKRVT